MTDAQYWAFLRNGLRRMWLKYPIKQQALMRARRQYIGDNKRQKWEYYCSMCDTWYKRTEVQVDHIMQCGQLTKISHIEGFVTRLFCRKVPDVQVLCVACHKEKTRSDRNA